MIKLTNNPIISIVIPVYNDQHILDKLFLNLDNQTLDNDLYEIIFVNDGSTDSSEYKIVNYIKEKDNCSLFNQINLKQAEARNHGIREARGEYVMFIDSDDSFDSDYLYVMYQNIGDDVIFSNIEKIFPNGNYVKEKSIFANDENKNDRLIGDYLSKGTEVDNGVWANLYNLKFLNDNHIQFENSNFFEDSLFNLKVLVNVNPNNISYLDYYGYKLVKHSETTTNSFSPNLYGLLLSYINKTGDLLKNKEIKLNKNVYRGFVVRQFIYLLHHYIKFSDYSSSLNINNNIKFKDAFNSKLPRKYKLAVFLIKFMFPVYFIIYKYSYKLKYS